MKYLYIWLIANKISLNNEKTEVVFFKKTGTKITYSDINIELNGTNLYPTNCIKYLGIYLDESLSGIYHCNELTKKLRRANGMLAKVRHYVLENELKSIYHAIFSSLMMYGCQVWDQNKNYAVKKIFKLQKNALRIITFSDYRASTNPLFKKLGILKISDNITLQNCLFVHDALNNKLPNNFKNIFKPSHANHIVSTRNASSGSLFQPYVRTTKYGKKSIKLSSISS